MKPLEFSQSLRRIASKLELSKRPRRDLVARDLSSLLRVVSRQATSMTYGTLPPRDQFEIAFIEKYPDGTVDFRNDRRVGNVELDSDELFSEVEAAILEFNEEGNEESGDWASMVLYALGFEWI